MKMRFSAVVALVASLLVAPILAEDIKVVDVQGVRIVTVKADAVPASTRQADVIVLGGSLGGVAASLAACDSGASVIMTEETDWLGGQASSQGVSALDENRLIETSGGTRTYLEFRGRIREWYRKNTKLVPQAAKDPRLDPGNSWVTALGFEPKVAVAAIGEMLAPHRNAGKLSVLLRHKIVRAHRDGRRVAWVDVVNLDTGELTRLSGETFIDATELGEPLVACGVGHVVGAESKEQTGEPHARADGAHPECVQSYTYPFALRLHKQPGKPIDKPQGYEQNAANQPYTFQHLYHDRRGWVRFGMFVQAPGSYGPFWTYRRLIDRALFEDPHYTEDVAMINWPGNDYRGRNLITDSPEDMLAALREAKELAQGFCYWLQMGAPRDEGGQGYPELALDAAVMGTTDGLSKYPYIRESRRIKPLYTVVEQDVAAEFNKDTARAKHFADSVGIGWYGIDIHPNDHEKKLPPAATKPFQIPLGSLIPGDTDNLLAACKNIGTTHITNGCYRLHPIEWNIGEAAGTLAARCVRSKQTPEQVRANTASMLELQGQLVKRGVPVFWYDDISATDGDFVKAQMTPFENASELERTRKTLHYRPAAATQEK